jgi:uncharacterized protein YbcI
MPYERSCFVPSDSQHERSTSANAQISRAHVRLFHEYTGRGPTESRTTIDRSLVVCFLSDLLTKGERSLIAAGKSAAVMEMRRSFQEAMREDLQAEVERVTGRKVVAFMSANHLDPDHAVEAYVLDRPAADSLEIV